MSKGPGVTSCAQASRLFFGSSLPVRLPAWTMKLCPQRRGGMPLWPMGKRSSNWVMHLASPVSA